jgi:hypothetical protein
MKWWHWVLIIIGIIIILSFLRFVILALLIKKEMEQTTIENQTLAT